MKDGRGTVVARDSPRDSERDELGSVRIMFEISTQQVYPSFVFANDVYFPTLITGSIKCKKLPLTKLSPDFSSQWNEYRNRSYSVNI